MKIDECFKDLRSLLGLHKIMNKSQHNMEKMVALLLIAYAIELLVGESLRDEMYGGPQLAPRQLPGAHEQTLETVLRAFCSHQTEDLVIRDGARPSHHYLLEHFYPPRSG
jgi:hypothetical protein